MSFSSEPCSFRDRPMAEAAGWFAGGFAATAMLSCIAVDLFGHGPWLVAAALASFAVMAAIALACLPRHHPHPRFGGANVVTLLRGVLVCLILGALAEAALWRTAPRVEPVLLAVVGVVAVSLDGLDGYLARRQKLASNFGARFDMEVDALLLLLLSVWVAVQGKVGPWVIAIGALRYLFVAAAWALPRLARPLPGSVRRKAVCVMQGIVLCVLLVPAVPPPAANILAALSLAALAWSFAADIAWLARGRALPIGLDSAAVIGLARSLAIYYAQPWRQRGLRRLYGGLVPRGALVFDLGAHVGNRTRALRALGAHVVAVEPQPLFAGFLKRTLPADVELVREAVGAAPGTATLRISSRHPTVSTLSAKWIESVGTSPGFDAVEWDRSVEVPVTTLDELMARFGVPHFVKIDVEGMEAEILRGLSRPLPLIAFEALPAAAAVAQDCLDRLEALGLYEFNLAAGESGRLAWARWRGAARMRADLAEWLASGCSGDVYARLSAGGASAPGEERATTIETAPGRLPASTISP